MFQTLLKKLKNNTKRRGKGYGSGKGGHTVGFGQKGQKARGRGKVKYFQEGGNTPLARRIPKYRGRGFTGSQKWISVNLSWLASKIENPETLVDISFLRKLGVDIPEGKKVRIFGKAEVKVPFKVAATIHVSRGAKESIEAARNK